MAVQDIPNGSAKPLFVGSIPTRASNKFPVFAISCRLTKLSGAYPASRLPDRPGLVPGPKAPETAGVLSRMTFVLRVLRKAVRG